MIDKTGSNYGPTGGVGIDGTNPDTPTGETVHCHRGGTGDGVDYHAGRDITVRDHRSFWERALEVMHGGPDWADVIKEDGGIERLLDAALDENSPDHDSAQKFITSKAGALAIQQEQQNRTLFMTTISNVMQAIFRMQSAMSQNLRG